MAKRVKQIIKMIVPAGQATPAPPLGTTLSQAQISIKDFCDQFNAQTMKNNGLLTPVVIKVYEDRSFSFELKTPPVSELIRRTLNIKKGSGNPNRKKVGVLTKEQAYAIAEQKLQDLNTSDLDQAVKIVLGTARQMGIDYKD